MKAREKGEASTWLGLPKWLALFLGVIVIAGAGFLLWLSGQALNRSSSLDARRVHALDIAADYIAKWPTVAATIGQTSLYHRDRASAGGGPGSGNIFYAHLYHPEFGDIEVKYDRGQSKCEPVVSIYRNRLKVSGNALEAPKIVPEPEKTYVERAREASWVPLQGNSNPVCFTIENLDLAKVAPLGRFSHLLLIEDPGKPDDQKPGGEPKKNDRNAKGEQSKEDQQVSWRDGRVVAWVGPSELPIRRLSDLPALENEVSKVVLETAGAAYVASTKQAAVQRGDAGATDALEPFNSRVAGRDYRFYWRPIAFEIPGEEADAEQQRASYYLVGVAPRDGAPERGRLRIEVLAFAVALFMLIALVPVVKLVLLGPVDTLKAIEVAGICLGIVVAAALGTALWTGVRDVLVARNDTKPEVASAAAGIVDIITRGLDGALISPEMDRLSTNLGSRAPKPLVVGSAANSATRDLPDLVKVENLVLLDANGRQALGTVMKAARDNVGANFNLNDRIYFRRAVDEDFVPKTEALARARRQRDVPCSIWRSIKDGLVFEQIRSRTDGAPKTIVAARLPTKLETDTECDRTFASMIKQDRRLRPIAVVAAFVMPQMLSPRLAPGIRYAVIDVHEGAAGHLVVFHSDSYRAGVELFDQSLGAETRAKMAEEIGAPADCGTSANATAPKTKTFGGTYEHEATIFAVARVPCTDWAVVTFKSRRQVDWWAVKPAVHAIIVWASLTILPYFLWMIAALRWGDKAWIWLWPEPSAPKKRAYLLLACMLGGAATLSMILVAMAAPMKGAILSGFSAIVALVWLLRVHVQGNDGPPARIALDEAISVLRVHVQGDDEPPAKIALDEGTERRFRWFATLLVITVAVVPIMALSADARGYFAQVSAAERAAVERSAGHWQFKSKNAIARMEGLEPAVEPKQAKETLAPRPHYFTEQLRIAAGYDEGLTPRKAPPTHWLLGFGYLGSIDAFTLVSLGLVIAVIVGLAIWASLWGLFGFGVALEAVEYPELPIEQDDNGDWSLKPGLPPRFLVIRASDNHLKALKKDAGEFEIDLNEEIRTSRYSLLPDREEGKLKLVLIQNLGLLLGDPELRRSALQRIEKILDHQGRPPNFRIAILTSLTPLERLLQSFERERDESDHLPYDQQKIARLERAKHREDMRWSAVFEEFTTYYHAARPRPAPAILADQSPAVKLIWEELEYVPDNAVAAMIWDPDPPVFEEEIINWAGGIAKTNAQPQAIVDYLASNLIEHYHLMWALSSRAERLLLYRIAFGHLPNIATAYALRSLVKRGLVVLNPYPRTMNKSFAQFVRHVESRETIKNWRRTQERGFWDVARLLFGLVLPLALGVLVVAAIRNGDSVAAVIPLIIAAGPALINALGSARRSSAA